MKINWSIGNNKFPKQPCYFVLCCNETSHHFPIYWCFVSKTKLVSKAHFDYFWNKAMMNANSVEWKTCRYWTTETYDQAIQLAQSIIAELQPTELKRESCIIPVDTYLYPNVDRYLNFVKKAFDFLKQPGNHIQISWNSSPMDINEFRSYFREAMHRRINSKGLDKRVFREETIALWRDQQRLNAWVSRPWHQQKTQWGLSFETSYVRKRYPHIERQMRERLQDSCK